MTEADNLLTRNDRAFPRNAERGSGNLSHDHRMKLRTSTVLQGDHRGITPASACSVVIAEDHDFARAGIAAILKRSRRCQVRGLARGEREAMQMVESQQPNVLILDLFLGHRDGISLIKYFVARYPYMKILAISDHSDLTYAKRAVRAGASGFLTKTASAAHLLAALDSVHHGQQYLARSCSVLISGTPDNRGFGASIEAIDRLTDRELHVFQLVGTGLGTGKIAKDLGLSRKTIEFYNEKIKQKLGCKNAASLKQRANEWMAAPRGHDRGSDFAQSAEKPGTFFNIHLGENVAF